jgi:hypothetical protein
MPKPPIVIKLKFAGRHKDQFENAQRIEEALAKLFQTNCFAIVLFDQPHDDFEIVTVRHISRKEMAETLKIYKPLAELEEITDG